MKHKIGLFTLVGIISLLQLANAEEVRVGHLETNDDTGSNWLFFHCDRNGIQMECDIFQTLILRPPSASDQASKLKKFLEGDPVRDFMQGFGEMCKSAEQLKSTTERAAITGKGFDGRVNPDEAKNRLPTVRAIATACATPTVESVKAFYSRMLDDESTTCSIHNDHSHSTFVFDQQTDSWITREGPIGPCGAINIGTLKHDEASQRFWKFTEKRLKTNQSGKLPNGISCSSLPDQTLNYTWRARDKYEGCKHIKNTMN